MNMEYDFLRPFMILNGELSVTIDLVAQSDAPLTPATAAAAAKAATAAAKAKAATAADKAKAAASGGGAPDGAGAPEGGAPRDPASQGRGWVPSATRWEAQHPDGHSWRETDEEIEITFPLPAAAASTKDVDVEIRAGSLRVCVLGEQLMAGETLGKLLVEESSWSFQPAEGEGESPVLQVDLVKKVRASQEEPLWGYVLRDELVAASSDRVDAARADGAAPPPPPSPPPLPPPAAARSRVSPPAMMAKPEPPKMRVGEGQKKIYAFLAGAGESAGPGTLVATLPCCRVPTAARGGLLDSRPKFVSLVRKPSLVSSPRPL